jgi:hypothetical protein
MKEIVSKLNSFIIFDFPVQSDFISRQFTSIHNNFQKQFPHWSLTATRRKLIANFWFRQVLFHFGALIAIATLFALIFNGNRPMAIGSVVVAVFLAGCICFVILTAFNYWPVYYSDFLPKLDTVIAQHEEEMEIAAVIKKCKRTQYSIPALTIIFYVFTKALEISFPACNDRSAELLNNLYGADKDKLKQNLSRLYKLSSLTPREKAEIEKGIESAKGFFEELGYPRAQQILQKLELKLQRA